MSASAPDALRDTLPGLVPGVSRETLDRFDAYGALLRRWQPRINLVSRSTLDTLEHRHILDSAQLHPLLPADARIVADLGSGAGFPGLVLAILGVPEVHLIESDTRKCAFLREAARITGTPVTVHNRRIEHVEPFRADVVTARALAPLTELLAYAEPFLGKGGGADGGKDGICLFLKGRQADDELTLAREHWKIQAEKIDSITDPAGIVLRIRARHLA
ncbi:MAG TPA: 16S rRNA (guanine(527)-N(7))-methyltransferase RsmG [Arenibaculum sp.]|nr:16S rRNA (guanine(527)-N(7))-methyltransferase RsmG [Arenibaculum sp.]